MPETMPFISLDWTLIIQLANTFILMVVLTKILFKPVKAMIDSRETEVKEMYDAAGAEKAQAQRLKEEYEQSLTGARQEAEQIVKEAQKRAQSRSDEIVGEAQQQAQSLIHRAEEEITLERRKAMDELRGEISDIAMLLAQKVIEKDLDEKSHEQLIASFIDGMGE